MQAFDLEPFARYIKERNLANERNIPYYVQWVQRFLTASLPDIATSSRDRIQAFENLLSKNQSIQDWQIRQALKAVDPHSASTTIHPGGPHAQTPAANDNTLTRHRPSSRNGLTEPLPSSRSASSLRKLMSRAQAALGLGRGRLDHQDCPSADL